MAHLANPEYQSSDALLQKATPSALVPEVHELDSDGNGNDGSFLSARSEHSIDDSACDSGDDSLADFIVSDSADEAELRRGSPRKNTLAQPPRRRMRRMIIESDSSDAEEEDEEQQSVVRGEQEFRDTSFAILDEDGADELIPQVDGLRLSPSESHEALTELLNPSATGSGFKDKDKVQDPVVKTPPFEGDENVHNTTGATNGALDTDNFIPSPCASPSKKPPPTLKKSKSATQEKQRQRAFASNRAAMAEHWISELDASITDNQIAQKTAASGGIAIVWSNRMRKTAGQALSRRDSKTGSWSCTITLSSSLITDEDRLYNTVAHEFAHVAVTLLHLGRCKPHGAEFFSYGAAISRAFPLRGIVFGRCHRYAVQFKYAWRCAGCAAEFQRHSRSLDPLKVRCGRCHGSIVLIRPQGQHADADAKGLSTYQAFVKDRFADTKARLEAENSAASASASAKDVMRELSRLWKAEKDARAEAQKGAEKAEDADADTDDDDGLLERGSEGGEADEEEEEQLDVVEILADGE